MVNATGPMKFIEDFPELLRHVATLSQGFRMPESILRNFQRRLTGKISLSVVIRRKLSPVCR